MKYSEYLLTTTQVTTAFMNQCISAAGASPDAEPYIDACQQAADEFARRQSYEAYDDFVTVASRLAEKLLFGLITSPQELATLQSAADEYSAAAQNIANTYLGNKAVEHPLQWLQKQDDGIYMHGEDGAEMTTDWDTLDIPTTPRPRRRYPQGVPLVPPEYLPKGKPKIKKLSPATPPTGGCASKKMPQMGQFCLRNQYPGYIFQFQWFDNILVRRTWYHHFDFEMHHEAYYKGSPIPMPTTFPPELVADLPKGRYAVTNTWQNSAIENPYGIDVYSRYEGWNWELKFKDYPAQPHQEWTRAETRTQGNDWVECLGLKYGDSPTYYHFPGMIGEDVGVSAGGEGRAVHYTTGMIELQYLGADFADVQETPTAAAYLASIGAVEALSFNNILNILRRQRWGR